MKKFYTSQIFLKMAGGRMHTPHPTSGHKLQKPSKESGIGNFSHLAPYFLVIFQFSVNGHGTFGIFQSLGMLHPSLNTLLSTSITHLWLNSDAS